MKRRSVPSGEDLTASTAQGEPGESSFDEVPGGVPTAGAEPGDGSETVGPRRRRIDRRLLWAGVAAVVLAVVAGVLFIPTPYYLFEPGSVRPAETRIDVTGAKSFETKGDVLFTTVYVDQATLATLLRGVFDDAVEVRSEEEVYGPEGRDASQKENQQRMDLSKLIATKVALQYLGYPATFTAEGAKVLGLADHGPAVGKLQVGDVITSVDGHPVSLPADIQTALSGSRPGDTVPVVANRMKGDRTTPVDVSITLGSAPAGDETGSTTTTTAPPGNAPPTAPATTVPGDAAASASTTGGPPTTGRPILGVSVEPDRPSVDSPVHVVIDSGDVTGPSAGLAWTLAVVDRLTPGSLTDRADVAVTGEILPDGTVGPIGGIVQKVSAVRRAGVKTFLYPASTDPKEVRRMKEVAGDAVRLVPVGTIAQAVEALHPGGLRKSG